MYKNGNCEKAHKTRPQREIKATQIGTRRICWLRDFVAKISIANAMMTRNHLHVILFVLTLATDFVRISTNAGRDATDFELAVTITQSGVGLVAKNVFANSRMSAPPIFHVLLFTLVALDLGLCQIQIRKNNQNKDQLDMHCRLVENVEKCEQNFLREVEALSQPWTDPQIYSCLLSKNFATPKSILLLNDIIESPHPDRERVTVPSHLRHNSKPFQ